MHDYCLVRLWQLRPGAPAGELEELITSGVLEMQRWIPGVKHLALVRLAGEPAGRYLVITTFTDYEAFKRWRQIEEEGGRARARKRKEASDHEGRPIGINLSLEAR